MSEDPKILPVDDRATLWSVPASERAEALANRPLIVLLHGYGASEQDLAGLFDALGAGYVLASVRAPLPLAGMGGAYAWFPLDPQRPAQPDTALADAATRGVLAWLEQIHSQVRSPAPVGILGFSQGAALSLQLLRHQPESFTCAVLLSGFVVPGLHGGDTSLAQIRPPVFTGHDPADPIIPPVATERLTAFAQEHTAVTSRRYSGAGHGITAQEMNDVVAFLGEHLPPSH